MSHHNYKRALSVLCSSICVLVYLLTGSAVHAQTLVSIAVTPSNPGLVVGGTQQFTAMGTYSDGSTQNLTSSVTWSSSNTAAATISSTGLATAVAAGSATVQAISGSVTGSATLTVATGAFPWIPYDMWIDFEQGTLGSEVTTSALAASTHGVAGTWSITDPNSLLSTQASAQEPANALTGDTGTRGMACNLNGGNTGYIEWTPPSSLSSFSIGLWYKTGTAVAWSGGPVFVRLYNNAYGPILYLTDEDSPYTNHRQINVNPWNQPVTGVANNTWYWITLKWTQGGQGTMSVYDTSLNLVGTSTFTDTTNAPVQTIALGNQGSVAEPGATSDFDDLIVDYTHGNFPLLPKAPESTSLVSIAVTPASGSVYTGATQQYTATGTFSDGSTQNLTNSVAWTSSNTSAATVSSSGLATGIAVGSATIQATSGTISGSANLTVTAPPALTSIAVTPSNPTVSIGSTQQFTATGTYSDGSTQNITSSVAWSSSASSVATISGSGLATVASTGNTTIQATLGSVSGSTGLTGTPQTAKFVTFTAGDAGSSVSSTTYLNNVQTGDLIIIFSHWDNQAITASASDSMGNVYTPISGPITVGSVGRFQAWYGKNVQGGAIGFTVTYSGKTTSLSVIDVAEYSGLDKTAPLDTYATAIGSGTTASIGPTPTSGSAPDTLVGLFGFDGYASPYTAGTGFTFRDYDASTFIEDEQITSIGSYTATATAQAPFAWAGYAVLFKNAYQGTPTLSSISVTPSNTSVTVGGTQQYTAIGTYSDGSTQNLTSSVAWSSSNTAAASISSAGLATAVAAGTSTIQAVSGTISGSTTLTVTASPVLTSVSVTPAGVSMTAGHTQQYVATGTFSDGSTQNLTSSVAWSSSNAATATISSAGVATAVAAGTTTIQATDGTVSGATGLTVTASPVLNSIAVTPSNPALVVGGTQQFTATGTYSDGSTQNLTSSVTWSSSNTAAATISSSGFATAVATGSTAIQAVSGSITGSATLSVANGAFPWIPYDMWIDFEQGTLGAEVTTSGLIASTHGVAGTWSINDPNSLLSIQASAEDTGHAATGDTGTRGMACNLNAGNAGYIEWDPPSALSSFSIGLWYKTGTAVAWSGGPPFVRFGNNAYGNVLWLTDEDSPYTNARQINVNPYNSPVAGVSDNTWYWVTLKWTQSGSGTMSVYDTSLNLVGTSTFTDTTNSTVQAIQLGNQGSVAEPGAVSDFDDLIVDYTHGNFPLLPKIPSAINLNVNPATVTNGGTSTGTVSLSTAAPTGGAVVSLSSSNSAVASVPSSVTIPAGTTSTTFSIGTGNVTFSATPTISATYSSLTATATLTVLPSTMSQVASDNFSRSNSSTLGPSWTPLLGTNDDSLQIVGGQVQSAAISPAIGKELYYGGSTWGADQYSEAQIVSAAGNGYAGPTVRMTSNDTYYACVVSNTGAGNAAVSIVVDVGGNSAVVTSSSTATVNQGDTVRCSIQGNQLTMTDETTSSTLLSATDESIISGYPGLIDDAGTGNVTNYTLANWAGGDIAAPLTLVEVASDNFDRPNALNLGSNWHIGTGHGPIQIVNDQLQPYPAGGPQPSKEHYIAAGPFPNDLWSQVQVDVEDVLGDNAAELRASDSADTMYIADVNITGGPGVAEVRIASVINGVITPLVIDTTWATVNQGDYIRGEARGNLISLIDVTTGSLLLTVTDSNVTSGYPGVSLQMLDGATSDHISGNWSGGIFQ